MMRTIHLHGALGEKYGRAFDLDVETAGEAVQALCTNFPEMAKEISDGSWHVVRGEDPDDGLDLDEEMIAGLRLGSGDLHIMPYIAGSKRGGVLKAVLGIALIGISFGFAGALAAPISSLTGAVTWGQALGMLGLALALGGVSQLLAPEQEDNGEEDDNSFLLSGSATSAREGTGIPLVYGLVITSGVLISTGLDVDQIGSYRNMAVASDAVQSLENFYGPGNVKVAE